MPRLPDPYGQRATPQSNARVLNYGEANQSGVAEIGNVISHIGKGIVERERELSVGRARNSVLLEQAKVLTELKDEPDYTKHEQIYSERMQKVRETAGKDLSPYAQEMLTLEFDRADQQGRLAVHENARRMQGIKAVADLEQANNDLGEAYKNTYGPLAPSILEGMWKNIQDAEARGDINPVEAGRMKREQGRRVVIAKAEMIKDLGQRKAYLDSAEGALVPAEDKAKLLEIAEEDSQLGRATAAADVAIATHGYDRTALLNEASKIKDPQVRLEAERQINNRVSQHLQGQAETRNLAYEDFVVGLTDGVSIAQQRAANPGAWNLLDGSLRSRLLAAENGEITRTDAGAFTSMMALVRQGKVGEAQSYLQEHRGQFSDTDFKSWTQKFNDPASLGGFLTDTQRIAAYAKQNNLGDETSANLQLEYDEWLRGKTAQGIVPSDDERTAHIDKLMIMDIDKWPDKRIVDMEPEERAANQAILDEIAVEFEKRKNRKPTPAELQMYFDRHKSL